MSYSQVAPAHVGIPPTGRATKRPGTLTAFLATGVVSALSAVVGAVIVFVGGNDLADQNIKDVIHDHPDIVGLPPGTSAAGIKALTGPMWDELVSDRAGTLAARAGFAIFTAVLLLIFTLCARKNAATWARVLTTLSGVVALFPHFLVLGDYEPDSVAAFSIVALITAVVAVVLCWLPPTNRFAKERKAEG